MNGPAKIAALGLALMASAADAQPDPFEGHWQNPKHSMVVNVSRCTAEEYCAVVIRASAKAEANARKGGTEHFVGTEILRVRAAGERTFKGTAFDPESNMHVSATVRMVGPGLMDLKGCAILGLVCERQRWTKVN
ncbi:MAG TPA: DUF2147 domain-containing protein [Sphingomicrobium sp.]|nr:DUF2147 domain-containing protein [Sphingomicrobium sp.]